MDETGWREGAQNGDIWVCITDGTEAVRFVLLRKISGGTRSSEGSQTKMGLASLFQTYQARGLNPFRQCLALLASP
jgi:hypothetical protein